VFGSPMVCNGSAPSDSGWNGRLPESLFPAPLYHTPELPQHSRR